MRLSVCMYVMALDRKVMIPTIFRAACYKNISEIANKFMAARYRRCVNVHSSRHIRDRNVNIVEEATFLANHVGCK